MAVRSRGVTLAMNEKDGFYREILHQLHDGVYFVDCDRRITFWNLGAERLTGYTAAEVVGKSCADNLLMHVDEHGRELCKAGCPVSQTLRDGQRREADVFLHHKEGHRVPVNVRVAPFQDDDGAVIGAVEVFNDNSAKTAATREKLRLEKLALLDSLTQVGNRRHAERQLDIASNEVDRYQAAVGALFIDVDRFKGVNDAYGHAAGDVVLKTVARTLTGSVRSYDTVCRWGGDEFLCIVRHVGRDELLTVAENARNLIERSFSDFEGGLLAVTVSVGAAMARPGEPWPTLVQRADALMYASKQNGGNRVTVETP